MGFQWSLEDRSVGEGFLRIARQQVDKAIEAAEDLGEAPERRVHEARRRAKKLRALLRLVRPDFKPYPEENRFVRDAARRLSTVRDSNVAVDTLEALMGWAGREAPQRPDSDMQVHDVGGALSEFASGMRAMLGRSEKWKAGKVGLDTLSEGLTATYRKGLEAMELVARRPSDAAFHEWRKHTKYHWNQLGLLESSADQVIPAAHKVAGELADRLGTHHDLAVLRAKMAEDAGQFGAIDQDFVLDAARRRQAELEAQIAVLGRQVYAERPRALGARFGSYLEGWVAQEAAA